MMAAPTKPTNMVYQGLDCEAWCDRCKAHCGILMQVYRLASTGVADLGNWLRCEHCGYWGQP